MLETHSPDLKAKKLRSEVPPTAIIIFGASGDLTSRKLIPAIYNLAFDSLLPKHFYLIGYGRKQMSNETFRELISESIEKFSRRSFDKSVWKAVEKNTFFQTGEYDSLEAFNELKEQLLEIEKQTGESLQIIFYISTPPGVFKTIIEKLGATKLSAHHRKTPLASKVIVEKPFGHDLKTAKELNKKLLKEFHEEQIYRIDHYLGKETVQDLLVQRFANSIFEPIWNEKYVDYVEITVAESLGIGNRGGYYDQSGALRDMIQNHTMQLLALVAMEPPISTRPEDIRNEKVKLLQSVQALNLKTKGGDAIRGQYTEGLIDGKKVPGYLEEEGIRLNSYTETYAALRMKIDNWRWNGVPFYIRSGKRMATKLSQIAIHFKEAPGNLFKKSKKYQLGTNSLIIQIQPDEGTTLLLNSKMPGLETYLKPIKMHFKYAIAYGSATPEAYERLILDALLGDSTLFIRGDETEASWRLCSPILDFWNESKEKGLESYPSGSWGPMAADKMLAKKGDSWHNALL